MGWLVERGMIRIYNCQLGIEVNDMYDAGYEANHVVDIDDCDVGCCPTDSLCLCGGTRSLVVGI